jgi:hypothetical protein
MIRAMLTVTAAVLVLVACGTDPEVSDRDRILGLLAENGFSEMDPLTSQGGGAGKQVEAPEGWFREKTGEGALEVTFWNDPSSGVCTLTVQRTLQGRLNIDVVHDGEWDPGSKPIDGVRTRHMLVERTGDASDPHGGWTLRAISVGEHGLAQGASVPQEVFVAAMRVYIDGELVWQTDDPTELYDVQTGLPEVEEGDLIRVEAEMLHENPIEDPPFFAFVHGPCPVWQRHPLSDAGLYGDRVAGDGVYSYEWYGEEVSHRSFVAVDVIDADTMEDQIEDDYDSAAWGIHFAK